MFKVLENVYHRLVTCFDKFRLSPSEKICVTDLMESTLEMMKKPFYFILKAIFILKIFKLLSQLFGHVEKMECTISELQNRVTKPSYAL